MNESFQLAMGVRVGSSHGKLLVRTGGTSNLGTILGALDHRSKRDPGDMTMSLIPYYAIATFTSTISTLHVPFAQARVWASHRP